MRISNQVKYMTDKHISAVQIQIQIDIQVQVQGQLNVKSTVGSVDIMQCDVQATGVLNKSRSFCAATLHYTGFNLHHLLELVIHSADIVRDSVCVLHG